MDRKIIQSVLTAYLGDVAKKISVEKAILFGSATSGTLGRDGDIDLLIISPSFTGMDAVNRFDLLYTARVHPLTQSVPMDIFGLTPAEYEHATTMSIIGEVKETGKDVTPSITSGF